MEKADPETHPEDLLTERQRDVLVCMAQGMTNTEIAKDLYLSQRSVERDIACARKAFNAESREVLLLLAYHFGVIKEEHLTVHVERLRDEARLVCRSGSHCA